VDEIWSLGARYCVRQDAHAFMWLWGLLLTLAGAAVVVARRGRRLQAGVLAFFAGCTGALGLTILFACRASALPSMGFVPEGMNTANVATFACIDRDAFTTAVLWTAVALSCNGALGLAVVGGGTSATARAVLFAGTALLLAVAGAAAFAAFFDFSWCSSSRLF
jgi:hypothetical protein